MNLELGDQDGQVGSCASIESGEDMQIPMERDSKNGIIVGSGISEYDEDEAINIPIINTLNSNQQRMQRKDDMEIVKLSMPRILEQKAINGTG